MIVYRDALEIHRSSSEFKQFDILIIFFALIRIQGGLLDADYTNFQGSTGELSSHALFVDDLDGLGTTAKFVLFSSSP